MELALVGAQELGREIAVPPGGGFGEQHAAERPGGAAPAEEPPELAADLPPPHPRRLDQDSRDRPTELDLDCLHPRLASSTRGWPDPPPVPKLAEKG